MENRIGPQFRIHGPLAEMDDLRIDFIFHRLFFLEVDYIRSNYVCTYIRAHHTVRPITSEIRQNTERDYLRVAIIGCAHTVPQNVFLRSYLPVCSLGILGNDFFGEECGNVNNNQHRSSITTRTLTSPFPISHNCNSNFIESTNRYPTSYCLHSKQRALYRKGVGLLQ